MRNLPTNWVAPLLEAGASQTTRGREWKYYRPWHLPIGRKALLPAGSYFCETSPGTGWMPVKGGVSRLKALVAAYLPRFAISWATSLR